MRYSKVMNSWFALPICALGVVASYVLIGGKMDAHGRWIVITAGQHELPPQTEEALRALNSYLRTERSCMVVLLGLAILALTMGKWRARASEAAAYVLRPVGKMLSFCMLAFFCAELIALVCSARLEHRIEFLDSWWWLAVLLIGVYLQFLGEAAVSVFHGRDGIAPLSVLLITGLLFWTALYWGLHTHCGGATARPSYWVVNGFGLSGSLNWGLLAFALTSTACIGIGVSTNAMLRIWYRAMLSQRLFVNALDETIEAAEAALSTCDGIPEFRSGFLNILGVASFRKAQYAQAVDYYTEALDDAPRSRVVFGPPGTKKARVYANRAEALLELRDFNGAISDSHEALAVDPDDAYVRALLAEAERKMNGSASS